MIYRFGAMVLLFAVAMPLLRSSPLFGDGVLPIQPVEGNPIPTRTGPDLGRRSESPTDVCFRWAQMSAVVNGTLYLYGGEASTEPNQEYNTWNNDFLTLDLTKTWPIASPSLTGLAQPSGPPAVALGTLWNSHDSLYLYGGEFSWKPAVSPSPFALWEYHIASSSWIEHNNPLTSEGINAPSNNDPVQRAAEGAGVSVPSLGRGFYFGGHEDGYTTADWSQNIARIYLQSLLEFTYPGYANNAVYALQGGKVAGTDGVYRNITQGGLQADAGFTARADGLLIYVPGFGAEGILLALAGGTNTTFTQMNEINVYDIALSSWYTQSTSGPTPKIRVNPCAVAASAPDGSSTNIYMFGGQNLQPYGNQTEYNDMWILTLPSFTWIQVDQSGQSVPYGRSGATCNIWDGQMVMVGGYVGNELTCESPGIYVYDLSNVQWVQQFTALSPGADPGSSPSSDSTSSTETSGSDFNSTGSNNPFNQQPAQIANASSPGGLEGSYGYTVPKIVVDVIGGGPSGGATVTAPVVTASSGPMATGKPITYTVYTVTHSPGSASTNNNGKGSNAPKIAATVVGVVCGLLFLLACYLAFCLYVYRKQLILYKRHVEMAQRQGHGEKTTDMTAFMAKDQITKSSSEPDRRRAAEALFGPSTSDSASQDAPSYYRNAGEATISGARASASGSGGRPSGSAGGYQGVRRESDASSTGDLLGDREPTFVGVMLNPRRSLRVINRD
ncbi:hypothetical protein M433DRAFT_63791 [Acidomyces richmondensis BFW]|nr:MAG: hypothetical protein FE78DRAFT_143340 [Acidomyces sp. 'richmondensis']KYG47121.1 hypothetical protein M433DRAFT_63791 [Acidomyces richmondensis BFW]